MKISLAIRNGVLFALLLVFQESSLASGTNVDMSKCHALLNIKDNLYLSDAAGKILAQYTSDQSSKSGISVAPDGSRVSFIPDDAVDHNTITVANKDGWHSDLSISLSADRGDAGSGADSNKEWTDDGIPEIPDNAVLVATTWIDDQTLMLGYHVSPQTGLFKFITLGPRMTPRKGSVKLGMGSDCTIGSHSRDIVCIEDRNVRYNNKYIYSDPGFAGAPVQDVVTLHVGGASEPVQGIPGVQIQAKSFDSGEVTLHVTLADDTWSEETIGEKDYMTVLMSEDQLLGLFPVKFDRRNNSVKLEVHVSAQVSGFRSLALWPPFDRRIAVIGNDQVAGTFTIRVLSLGENGEWDVVGPVALPINGSISSVRFISANQLYFETGVRAGILPMTIAKSNSGPGIQLGTVSYFPSNINVNFNQQKVSSRPITWACN